MDAELRPTDIAEEKMQKNAENFEEKVQINAQSPDILQKLDDIMDRANAQNAEILQKLDDIMDRMTVYDWAISNGYIPSRKKKEEMEDD